MDRLLDLWLKSLSRAKSQRTIITYKTCLSTFQKHLGEGKSLLDVEQGDIYSYIDSTDLSVSSIFTHLSAIKHFYRFAFRMAGELFYHFCWKTCIHKVRYIGVPEAVDRERNTKLLR